MTDILFVVLTLLALVLIRALALAAFRRFRAFLRAGREKSR